MSITLRSFGERAWLRLQFLLFHRMDSTDTCEEAAPLADYGLYTLAPIASLVFVISAVHEIKGKTFEEM